MIGVIDIGNIVAALECMLDRIISVGSVIIIPLPKCIKCNRAILDHLFGNFAKSIHRCNI